MGMRLILRRDYSKTAMIGPVICESGLASPVTYVRCRIACNSAGGTEKRASRFRTAEGLIGVAPELDPGLSMVTDVQAKE